MTLCFLGKYPPIEGGVSTENYWAARGLAQHGHDVHVVTNAFEVERPYRMSLYDDDASWLESSFPSGGSVTVHPTPHYDPRDLTHIPGSNPFVSKLAAIGTEVVRRYNCDLIFAFYFEPYGMAGSLVSNWTDCPLAVQHAGSDLDRLMPNAYLGPAYQEMLGAADAILTGGHHVRRFASFGVSPDRIYPRSGIVLQPDPPFSPTPKPDDADRVRNRAHQLGASPSDAPIDLSVPTIGIYGKVGETKGSFDLVQAVGRLRRQGVSLNLLAMTQGRAMRRFEASIQDAGIEDCTWLMPFVPNWRVPHVIRSCTAVCFLERDFPIGIHGPRIPREIMACGTCLVLSREIADKQVYRDTFQSGTNVHIVNDPKEIDDLAATLRIVVDDPSAAAQMGRRGRSIADTFRPFEASIQGYDALFRRIVGRDSDARSFQAVRAEAGVAAPDTDFPAPFQGYLNPSVPWKALFGGPDAFAELTADFLQSHSGCLDAVAPLCALDFLRNLEQRLSEGTLHPAHPSAPDLLRYQRARLDIRWSRSPESSVPLRLPTLADVFPAAESAATTAHGDRVPRSFRLRRTRRTIAEAFTTDVTPLFAGTFTPATHNRATLEDLDRLAVHPPKAALGVVFQRYPNGQVREFEVNAATFALLEAALRADTVADMRRQLDPGLELTDADLAAGLHLLLEHDLIEAVSPHSVHESRPATGASSQP